VQEPLLNYKLRKKYLSGANFYYVGSFASLAFYMKHVSNQKLFLVRYLEGKTWLNSVNMGVISDVLSSKFFLRHNYLLSQNIYVMLLTLYPSQNSWYNLMAYDGVNSQNVNLNKLLVSFNVGSDWVDTLAIKLSKSINIYVGHHQDFGLVIANIILPAFSIFEKKSEFFNLFHSMISTIKLVVGGKRMRMVKTDV